MPGTEQLHVLSPVSGTSRMAPLVVGLVNQGATGCLNVVLQALFHIPAIRDAVLSLPLDGHPNPKRSPPLAWQRLFRRIQSCLGKQRPICTKEMTLSMGWKAHHLNLGQVSVTA